MPIRERVPGYLRWVSEAIRRGGHGHEPPELCPLAMRALLDMDGMACAARAVVAGPPPPPGRMEVKPVLFFGEDWGSGPDSAVFTTLPRHGKSEAVRRYICDAGLQVVEDPNLPRGVLVARRPT